MVEVPDSRIELDSGTEVMPRGRLGRKSVDYNDGDEGVFGSFFEDAGAIDVCASAAVLAGMPDLALVSEARDAAMNRGVRFRYLVDVTGENLAACKEVREFAEEVRHLGGICTTFAVSERTYLAGAVATRAQPGNDDDDDDNNENAGRSISGSKNGGSRYYVPSSAPAIVEHQRSLFEAL